jgi:hypothetical protein
MDQRKRALFAGISGLIPCRDPQVVIRRSTAAIFLLGIAPPTRLFANSEAGYICA